MDEQLKMMFVFVESVGILAPLAFILFHLLRQFLFIPVAVVCIAGGVLFGTVFGTIYSLVGLTMVSVLFYFVVNKMPRTYEKLSKIKGKWFGPYRNLTISQIAILRLIPFIHFHLMNFCLLQRKKSLKEFVWGSLYSNLPLAFFYTIFGQFISRFTPTMILIILFALTMLVYLLREKMSIIKWKEFFKVSTS
ncbi:TVP38/TMEM64 family protein [Bacillus sp. CGMCC 1.16607]|uniref:TVP38/TMEM64 family protein n=1 Tax=Bacillus sp. CGMCC 1.16607 TaxID=3351842 RepID=UPI003637BC7B